MTFSTPELAKLTQYLQSKVNPKISLKTRAKSDDSVEFLLDGEYLGTVYRDTEDGEVSYNVNLSILADDLDEVA